MLRPHPLKYKNDVQAKRSRDEGGMASKLTDYTRLMIMKGGTVLDSVKMLACMFEGM